MNENQNPYSAPNSMASDRDSFWGAVKKFFLGEPGIRERFLGGEPLIQFGVMFFVEPEDNCTIHAAIPLSSNKENLIELAVSEAKRELSNLLEKHNELRTDLKDRTLQIRFISQYQDVDDQICDPVVADWFFESQGGSRQERE